MRVAPAQIAGLLRDPARVSLLLLFGEDAGLVRARAAQAARAVLGTEADPFRLSVLAREEHARVVDEARSLSLVGGRRVVRVMDAADALAVPLAKLADGDLSSLVILEAGALTAKSKLRALAEKRADWAAIECRTASPAMVAGEVRAALQAGACTATEGAIQALSAALPGDTAARAAELDKLLSYAGPGGVVDEEAVLACCVDTTEVSFAALFDAALGGDLEATATLAQRAVDDGATGPGIIAAFGYPVQRLLKLRALVDEGIGAEAACGMLMPPVYPRQAAALMRQLRAWSWDGLLQLSADLRMADLACKRAGARDDTIGSYLLLLTARRAARSRR